MSENASSGVGSAKPRCRGARLKLGAHLLR